ncbi:NAD-dependent epimerase/dehydratase family protein [Hymenobacter sp. HMF4947]|uniref:NAD-dependent epimerase/dehydratase family protein n=1 Tax=Hymenobacter ginkgonis TaxID=2682976 RepID=A0A7K1TD02_9BACT|nr:NAD-dependent epimerase/dehydratase family protein [Hymenobacter ginkgonis]MVN76278.1 NAD-dependent epimerase/dehydratase family protein [Hymenobacter ginkgonis]
MAQRIIITGATGMVGEGVLLTCLAQPDVEAVLSVSRRPSGHSHPKLNELLVPDFFDLTGVEDELVGYTACYFCAGVSAVGMGEADYIRATHDLTLHFAQTLARLNPKMSFSYISGAGTDSHEKSRQMWARVKGRTENELLQLPFRATYMFRPGFLKPVNGQKHILPLYRWIGWLYPVLRRVAPGTACSLGELGLAMLHVSQLGYSKPVLDVKDIVRLAKPA